MPRWPAKKLHPFFVGVGAHFFSFTHPGEDHHNHEIDADGFGDCEACAKVVPAVHIEPEPETVPEAKSTGSPEIVGTTPGAAVGENLGLVLGEAGSG